ncbi:hypothetical protein, partial [Salmonella sp. s54836]|uniref:hypothetical protein n=1 Tax=Salmonella sp. s54836 TaxID=3159673 RepID=UPI0039810B54
MKIKFIQKYTLMKYILIEIILLYFTRIKYIKPIINVGTPRRSIPGQRVRITGTSSRAARVNKDISPPNNDHLIKRVSAT